VNEQSLPTLSDVPVSEALEIEKACSQFERDWKAWQGRPRPALESWLTRPAGPARTVLLGELLRLELAYRRQAGDLPSLDEYLARFPADEELLRSVFAAKARSDAQQAPPPHGQLPAPSPAEETLAGDSEPIGAANGELRAFPKVPGYEILGELGRGGMGPGDGPGTRTLLGHRSDQQPGAQRERQAAVFGQWRPDHQGVGREHRAIAANQLSRSGSGGVLASPSSQARLPSWWAQQCRDQDQRPRGPRQKRCGCQAAWMRSDQCPRSLVPNAVTL
jgi:hypothetical protein